MPRSVKGPASTFPTYHPEVAPLLDAALIADMEGAGWGSAMRQVANTFRKKGGRVRLGQTLQKVGTTASLLDPRLAQAGAAANLIGTQLEGKGVVLAGVHGSGLELAGVHGGKFKLGKALKKVKKAANRKNTANLSRVGQQLAQTFGDEKTKNLASQLALVESIVQASDAPVAGQAVVEGQGFNLAKLAKKAKKAANRKNTAKLSRVGQQLAQNFGDERTKQLASQLATAEAIIQGEGLRRNRRGGSLLDQEIARSARPRPL